MTNSVRTIGCIAVFAGVLGTAPGVHAEPGDQSARKPCSLSTLRGSYGFGGIGTVVVGPGTTIPLAVTGRIDADGVGYLSGTQTRVRDGVLFRETFTGAYQVAPDCTGSDILYFEGRAPITRDFVIVGQGREVRYIVTGSLPGAVITITATRQLSQRDASE